MVDQVSVKLPNALTYSELLGEGKSPEEARRIMNERVFGADYKTDEHGNPIEQGLGSKANPTPQHVAVLKRTQEQEARANPNSADVIAKAVAEGVKAGLAAGKEQF